MNEKKVEIILGNWFKSYKIPRWFNRLSDGFDKKFTTKGSQKKPDMIILSNNKYYAIEIKDAEISRNVYDSNKIIKYMKDYCEGKISYYIDDQKINIHSFLIATQYSLQGKLFKDDDNLINPDEKWNEILKKWGNEPLCEFQNTKKFLRALWSFWRLTRNNNDRGIGILLSNILDKKDDYSPRIFHQIHSKNNFDFKKERWYVKWQLL